MQAGPGLQRFYAKLGRKMNKASAGSDQTVGSDGTRGALALGESAPREFEASAVKRKLRQPSEWARSVPLHLYQLPSLETSPT